MQTEDDTTLLDEVRAIDERLAEVDALARGVEQGRMQCDAPLRLRSLELLERLDRRFALDLRELVPALRASQPWGVERAERLASDRREQRLLLRFLLAGLADRGRPPRWLANRMRDFARAVRDDLEAEEWITVDPQPLRAAVFVDVEIQ